MPTFRPGTNDKEIWDHVVENNEWQLPEDMAGWTVLDIGGHIGSFAYACMVRGATNIHSFEPDPGNVVQFVLNVGPDLDRVVDPILYEVAVDASANWATLHRCSIPGGHSGHTLSLHNTGGPAVWTIPFDACVALAGGTVDFCKIDCEGSEYAIIKESRFLKRCKRLAIEFHEPNYRPCPEALARLEDMGFKRTGASQRYMPLALMWFGEHESISG